MSQNKEQAHVVYKCDYHIVWTLKYLKGQRFVQQQRTEGLKNDGGYAPKFIINPPALQVDV
ncbi:MAG: hypothetical protein IPK35_01240 [Saprospiraceae bacterium]|jgi:hypothetical protein|nr:hypothetical protein [Saprospiraceae bacterium]